MKENLTITKVINGYIITEDDEETMVFSTMEDLLDFIRNHFGEDYASRV